jgi:hypothetical protein
MDQKFACRFLGGIIALVLLGPAALTVRAQAVPAFPGADGAGAAITGGAGGSVYHVNTLDTKIGDNRPGTFYYGIQNASGPTTIVFDVGGTIWLGRNVGDNEGWDTSNAISIGSNITVAGQTAPGGIYFAGGQVKVNGTLSGTARNANTIIRNITMAPGYGERKANGTSGYYDQYTYDAMDVNSNGVMIDHVSAFFATDETISANETANNVSVQYSTLAQGQNYPEADAEGNGNYVGHSFGDLWGIGSNAKTTFSHDLYVNIGGRIPTIQTVSSALVNNQPGFTDFRNNVVYNWYGYAGYGSSGEPGSGNFVNNFYKVGHGGDGTTGNNTDPSIVQNVPAGSQPFKGSSSTGVYETGNTRLNLNGTTTNLTNSDFGSSVFSSTPFSVPYNGTTDSPTAAFNQVLNYAGANWQNRDMVDQRVVYDAQTGNGQIKALDDPNNGYVDVPGNPAADVYVAGNGAGNEWNTILSWRNATNGGIGGTGSFARAANFDTDGDGMPDVWEQAVGTNPASADNNGNVENNGYTNLQNYLNDLGAFPASTALVFNNANGTSRYAQIGNWQTGVFEPSRFDTAQINTGTATVDVPDQHAGTLQVGETAGNSGILTITGGWIDIAQSLQISPVGTGTVSQSNGIVHAVNSIVIGGTNNAGTYNLSGGTLSTALLTKGTKGGTFNFTGGTLHALTVAFDLIDNGGTIAPGSDASLAAIAAAAMPDINNFTYTDPGLIGNTQIQGNLTLNSGTLQIDLASLSSFDSLTIDKALTLGGNLEVDQLNGFTTAPGQKWLIGQTTNGVTGGFASITPGFTTEIVGNNLFLETVPEPASAALFGIAGLWTLRRRR